MKTLKTIVAISILTFTLSCSKEKELYDHFSKDVTLSETHQIIIEDKLSSIGKMMFIDNLLFIQSYNSSHNFYVINPDNGKCLNKLISYGRGHNESIWSNMLNCYNDSFIFYDINKSQIGAISRVNILNNIDTLKTINIIKDEKYIYGVDILLLSNNRYLFNGLNIENKKPLKITNSKFETLFSFGEINIEDENDTSDQLLELSSQGFLTTNSQCKQVVYTSFSGNLIKFYDCSSENQEPIKKREYIYNIPKMKFIDHQGMKTQIPDANNIVGTISITASDDLFFLLHMNSTLLDSKGKRESNIILVFDINGKPINRLLLDKEVQLIAYNKNDNSLYALSSNENDDILIKYKL